MRPQTLYFAHGIGSFFLVLCSKTVVGSNTCAKCALDVHFYCGFRMFLDSRPFGALGSPGTNFVYLFIDFILFVSFWRPESQSRWHFIKVRCIFLKRLGGSCSMFLQVSKLWRFCVTVYCPKCWTKTSWRPWDLLGLLGRALLVASYGYTNHSFTGIYNEFCVPAPQNRVFTEVL